MQMKRLFKGETQMEKWVHASQLPKGVYKIQPNTVHNTADSADLMKCNVLLNAIMRGLQWTINIFISLFLNGQQM